MSNFAMIDFDVNGYKVKQVVIENGEPVEKTSPVDFWVVHDIGRGRCLYSPVSKLDRQNNISILSSCFFSVYQERGRSIVRKTSKGTVVYPFGGIIR